MSLKGAGGGQLREAMGLIGFPYRESERSQGETYGYGPGGRMKTDASGCFGWGRQGVYGKGIAKEGLFNGINGYTKVLLHPRHFTLHITINNYIQSRPFLMNRKQLHISEAHYHISKSQQDSNPGPFSGSPQLSPFRKKRYVEV